MLATPNALPPAPRIAAVWNGRLTYLPRWTPRGLVARHWWSETCACGTDDNRLIVQLSRRSTVLLWVVTDPREYHRRQNGVSCLGGGRTHVRRGATYDLAWACLRVSGRWARNFDVLHTLVVSVRQERGKPGQLTRSELRKLVASARPSPPGRVARGTFQLPSAREAVRMARAFGRPLLLPTRLPGGFMYSDWSVIRATAYDRRRHVIVRFGRDSLFAQIQWSVYSGWDRFDCGGHNPRRIHVNEAIHGVQVWRCLPGHTEVALWYDIRLHRPAMLRLAIRMVATATRVSA